MLHLFTLKGFKKHAVVLLCSLIPYGAIHAASKETASNCPTFETIDSLISEQPRILQEKMQHLRMISSSLDSKAMSDIERYIVNEHLYNEYLALKYDSAFKYSEMNIRLAQQMGDKTKLVKSILNQVHIISVAGLFDEAGKMLESIDTLTLDDNCMIPYLKQMSEYYLYKAEFSGDTKYFDEYVTQQNIYRRKILCRASPESYDHKIAHASYECYLGNYDHAIAILEACLPQLKQGTRDYSIVTSTLAFFNLYQNNAEERQRYLMLSAISDLEGGIMENNALRELSAMLFEQGHLERANLYLNVSVNDASFYGTRLRNIQASQLLPQIEGAYKAFRDMKEKSQNTRFVAISVTSALLLVAILIFIYMLKRYHMANRRTKETNKRLETLVKQLEDMNGRIKEGDRLKEEYIGRFLALASTFIDMTADRHKKLNRMAKERKLPELYSALKDDTLNHSLSNMFYSNFDSAFLNIHPRFVSQVSGLLGDNAGISLKHPEHLSTEFRILALIRLGITDNASIARILRSSITTIYTYRSKLKNLAIDKASFEKDIQGIE